MRQEITELAIAQGEYLSFLDADDFFEKNMLEESYNAACVKNAEICVFNADLYDCAEKTYKSVHGHFENQYFPENEPFSST